MIGNNVGNINHSKYALLKLRDAFSQEILDCIKKFITESPCVSLVADKVTIKGAKTPN